MRGIEPATEQVVLKDLKRNSHGLKFPTLHQSLTMVAIMYTEILQANHPVLVAGDLILKPCREFSISG